MAGYTTLEKLKIRLRQFAESGSTIVFTQLSENPVLENLIEKAKADITLKRNYPSTYTATEIEADIAKHENITVDLALFDYVTEGAEFQDSHNENGISRGYTSRDYILEKVISFAHVI